MSNAFTEILEAALAEAGVGALLGPALARAGLDAVPREPAARHAFLTEALLDALLDAMPADEAEAVVEAVLTRLHRSDDDAPAEAGEDDAAGDEIITVPPETGENTEAYADLVSGAVHDRVTPAWGLLRPGPADGRWLLVTTDETLIDMARAGAPSGTRVEVVVDAVNLAAALEDAPRSTLVLDGAGPSLPVREVMERLDGVELGRAYAWRMRDDDRARWSRVAPSPERWRTLDGALDVGEVVATLRRGSVEIR